MEYWFLIRSCVTSAVVNVLHPRPGVARRIVVFKLDHLGDLLTAVPALYALRTRNEEAEITLVAGSWCADFARVFLPVDHVAVYDSPTFDRELRARGGGDAESLRQVLPGPFDAAYGLREDPATLAFSLRGGCRHRRDRGTVRWADRSRRLLLQLSGRGDPGPLSERETNLRIVGAGEADVPHGPLLRPRAEDTERVRTDIVSVAGGSGGPLVVIHPGAAWRYKRWPVERCSELAGRLSRDLGATVFVTGSDSERELAGRVADGAVRGRAVAGDYELPAVVALLAAADVYVGADTGITHLASLVGTPLVALFGPGDPQRFGPAGGAEVIISHRQSCTPCEQRECAQDGACMRAITVDEVEAAVRGVVGSGRYRRPDGEAEE